MRKVQITGSREDEVSIEPIPCDCEYSALTKQPLCEFFLSSQKKAKRNMISKTAFIVLVRYLVGYFLNAC